MSPTSPGFIQRLKLLDIKEETVLVLTVSVEHATEEMAWAVQEALNNSEFKDTPIIILPDTMDLAAVTEEDMAKMGWVRAEKTREVRA